MMLASKATKMKGDSEREVHRPVGTGVKRRMRVARFGDREVIRTSIGKTGETPRAKAKAKERRTQWTL
jgi:hypothetical protein